MTYLRNAWYCAGWGEDISRTPIARTFLNEPVLLYRKEAGDAVAIGDTCPHRFAPLHQGPLHGDIVACPYHGLRFDETGACVHNPHGDRIPSAARVKAYPLVERYGAAWIWMGEPEKADETKIPVLSGHDEPGFRVFHSYIHVKGSYQLVSDNLLDLSHTEYLHAALQTEGSDTRSSEMRQEGDTIITRTASLDCMSSFARFLWPDAPERVDQLGGLRWEAPANMLLTINMTRVGRPGAEGILGYGGELVTPETETTTHYFFSLARNFRLDDEEFHATLMALNSSIFETEDGGMIADIQNYMGDQTDLLALKPIILPTDSAAVRGRMILKTLIKAEQDQNHRLVKQRQSVDA